MRIVVDLTGSVNGYELRTHLRKAEVNSTKIIEKQTTKTRNQSFFYNKSYLK